MSIRPHPGHSSLAIRMLARKSLACGSRCAQTPFLSDFTTSFTELAVGLTPPRVDPLANPVLSPSLQTVRGAGPLPRLHRRGPIEAHSRRAGLIGRPDLFHGFIAVAPLKPSGWPRASCRYGLFHGFIAVAPLKHSHVRSPGQGPALFHGFIAVAPLKHAKRRSGTG